MIRLRAGHTLAEAVAALVAGIVLLATLASALRLQARVSADLAAAVNAQDNAALSWAVLAAELRYTLPLDVRAGARDSLALRSFRGVGAPCGEGETYVWAGMRRPSAGKDSAVGARSGETAHLIHASDVPVGHEDPGCETAAGTLLRLRFQPPLARDEPILAFESGAYHLSGGALRYRLGGEGRQPLTDMWLDERLSYFIAEPGPITGVRLVPLSAGRTRMPPELIPLATLHGRSDADAP